MPESHMKSSKLAPNNFLMWAVKQPQCMPKVERGPAGLVAGSGLRPRIHTLRSPDWGRGGPLLGRCLADGASRSRGAA